MSLSSMASILANSALTSSFSFSDTIDALRLMLAVALVDAKLPFTFRGPNDSVSTLAEVLVGVGDGFDEEAFASDFLGILAGLVSPFGTLEEFLNTFEAGIAREVAFGGSGGPLDSILEKDMGSDLFEGVFSSRGAESFVAGSSSIVPCDDGRSPYPFALLM